MSAFENQDMTPLCYIEAFIRQCAWVLSIFFATCLAILCYKASSKFRFGFNQGAFFKKCLVFGFLICAFLTSMPKFVPAFGYINSDLKCNINVKNIATNTEALLFQIVYIFVPMMGGLTISLISYIATIMRMRKSSRYDDGENDLYKLFWYPAIIFAVFLPTVLLTFAEDNHTLLTVHFTVTHSLGILNALVYGIQMRSYYSSKLNEPDLSRFSSMVIDPEDTENEIFLTHKYTRTSY